MSTVGYRSAAAHLEDELARADLLLRSAVALHVAGLAGDTDSLRWGLSEVTPGEVATYLSAPPPPARPDFDDDPRAAGFRAKAATRRCEIDNRLAASRSEEHTSELQSLMRTSYDVFCLTKKT